MDSMHAPSRPQAYKVMTCIILQTGKYKHGFHAVDVQAPNGAADLTRRIPKGSYYISLSILFYVLL